MNARPIDSRWGRCARFVFALSAMLALAARPVSAESTARPSVRPVTKGAEASDETPGVPESLPAAAVFQRASPSVFVVLARVTPGETQFSQGSAVALAADVVVTNYHVVRGRAVLEVRRDGVGHAGTLTAFDEKRDLALLKVEGLRARPARVRRAPELAVGERVYAIGSPRGLELTFSDGLISALRDADSGRLIQTTAPISPGSSGGGLFDGEGQLIGITTFTAVESQNLNFAHPVSWVEALQSGAAPSTAGGTPPPVTPEWDIAHRPSVLACTVDREQIWAFFPSGDEILESKSAREMLYFTGFDGQTPRVTLGSLPLGSELIIVNMNRRLGWLWYLTDEGNAAGGRRPFYLFDVTGGEFQVTRFEPFTFHGQPRYRAFSGACKPEPTAPTAPRPAPTSCADGAAPRCLTEAEALPAAQTARRLVLLQRGCELGDVQSCRVGANLAEASGVRTVAAALRSAANRLSGGMAQPSAPATQPPQH